MMCSEAGYLCLTITPVVTYILSVISHLFSLSCRVSHVRKCKITATSQSMDTKDPKNAKETSPYRKLWDNRII